LLQTELIDVQASGGKGRDAWCSGLAFGAAALPALVILLLYVWRPLKLGFYADDWMILLHPQPGSLAAWSDVLSLFQNRPVMGVVTWLAQAASGWDPAYAQVVNVLLMLVSAIGVGWLTFSLAGLLTAQHVARLWGAGLAAAAYLAFPWTLGFSAWTTTAAGAAPAAFFFCIAARLLVEPGSERLPTQIIACLLMAVSFLAYEAFYGQFIIVLALAAVLRPVRPLSWMMLRPALLLLMTNIACFTYNRLAEGGGRKTFSAYWYQTFVNGYFHYLWPNFLRSFREVAPIIVACLIVVLGVGVALLAHNIGRSRAALVVLAVSAGFFGAGLFYAIGGYPLITVGIFARVTVVLSVYWAVFLGLLGAASAARQAHERWLGRAQIAASVILVGAFGIASLYRLADWTQSWAVETNALRQFPGTGSAKAADGAHPGYLYVGPLGPPRRANRECGMGGSGSDRLSDISRRSGGRAANHDRSLERTRRTVAGSAAQLVDGF